MKNTVLLTLLLTINLSLFQKNTIAQNNDDAIRKEALQEWKNMKFGMFIHWGVYSVPAGVWEGKQIEKLGEQIQRHARISAEDYKEVAARFNPVKFDADKIVELAKNTGMKYIVLTAKHHDGFCMWDSKHTDWDIMESSPYKKDILKALADACKKHGLKIGIYYSTPDWHFNGPNPEINPADGKISVFSKVSKANEDYQVNHLKELLTNYGDIVELFFDMGEPTAEQSKRFAETVHAIQPKCVINGRIMNNQGDFLTMPDNHVPDVPIDTLAWETPGTFYHTWGYKSWVKGAPLDVQIKKQVRKLSRIVARGGNFLLNIGPKSDGTVVQYEQDVLAGVGEWMSKYNEAIYETGTTPFVKLPWGECTTKEGKLYLHVFDWPQNGKLLVPGLKNEVTNVYPLGTAHSDAKYSMTRAGVEIDLTGITEDKNLTILVMEYDGVLRIRQPLIKPTKEGEIIISGSEALKHGKFGRVSYRSILKDFYRSWDVKLEENKEYNVQFFYKMKYDEKNFVLALGENNLDFTLTGKGVKKEEAETLDGNEIQKEEVQISASGFYAQKVGKIRSSKDGRNTLYLKQNSDFDFKATTKEFNAQDQKYRTLNIEIEKIVLTPER